MTFQALQDRSEVRRARTRLQTRGLDARTSFLHNVLHKLGLARGARVGDVKKSWDVAKTVEFLEERLGREDELVDFGAYASEILPILHRLGFEKLTGIDFDPRIEAMPYATDVRYLQANFLRSDLPRESYVAITAISVIEHGFDAEVLLKEISRLLKPGGFFIASVDYWPEKIDTTGIQLFGLDWCIFSAQEIRQWFEEASRYQLEPIGELELDVPSPTIRWGGQNYTFGWMVLQKAASQASARQKSDPRNPGLQNQP